MIMSVRQVGCTATAVECSNQGGAGWLLTSDSDSRVAWLAGEPVEHHTRDGRRDTSQRGRLGSGKTPVR